MSSILMLVALAAMVLAMIHWAGVQGTGFRFAAAALLVGCGCYMLQGRPGLAGSPAVGVTSRPPQPLSAPRHAFFGEFNSAERWLIIADSYSRRGDTEKAAGLLGSAVRHDPRNAILWTGLGNALVDHASGRMTPAAELAFKRAAGLAPNHPGPLFFHGLALGRSGDREAALTLWHEALERTPPGAPWASGLRAALAQAEDPALSAEQ